MNLYFKAQWKKNGAKGDIINTKCRHSCLSFNQFFLIGVQNSIASILEQLFHQERISVIFLNPTDLQEQNNKIFGLNTNSKWIENMNHTIIKKSKSLHFLDYKKQHIKILDHNSSPAAANVSSCYIRHHFEEIKSSKHLFDRTNPVRST
jgi:hypothetical protein